MSMGRSLFGSAAGQVGHWHGFSECGDLAAASRTGQSCARQCNTLPTSGLRPALSVLAPSAPPSYPQQAATSHPSLPATPPTPHNSTLHLHPALLTAFPPLAPPPPPLQAILLGWSTVVKKGSAADELQGWQMAPYAEACLSQPRSHFLLQATARLQRARHERGCAVPSPFPFPPCTWTDLHPENPTSIRMLPPTRAPHALGPTSPQHPV